MRKPRRIAVLALAGVGLFGAVGLDSLPAAHALQVVGQPPDEGCNPVPGAPKDYCPPPPDEPCPTSTPSDNCPGEEPCVVSDVTGADGLTHRTVVGDPDRCPPPPPCDVRRCPPPPECENTCMTTTSTTTVKKTPPGVLWNPSYTG
jgi:hypothetical protein